GRVWVVVDITMDIDSESVSDEKKKYVRDYAYWISPQQMLDMAWDDYGNLIRALIVEVINKLPSTSEQAAREVVQKIF
ncbi:hypothetical protein Q6327_29120, partial [Klebsiella pneumoniae]|nr:hypothetical protein [Klebsiella pneumoniae]